MMIMLKPHRLNVQAVYSQACSHSCSTMQVTRPSPLRTCRQAL